MPGRKKKPAAFGDTLNHEERLVRDRWSSTLGVLGGFISGPFIYVQVRPYSHTASIVWAVLFLGAYVQMVYAAIKGWAIWIRRRRER